MNQTNITNYDVKQKKSTKQKDKYCVNKDAIQCHEDL